MGDQQKEACTKKREKNREHDELRAKGGIDLYYRRWRLLFKNMNKKR